MFDEEAGVVECQCGAPMIEIGTCGYLTLMRCTVCGDEADVDLDGTLRFESDTEDEIGELYDQ